MMKKKVALFLVVGLTVSSFLTGCNGKSSEEVSEGSTKIETQEKNLDVNDSKDEKLAVDETVSNSSKKEESKSEVTKEKETIREYSVESSEGVEIVSFDSSDGSIKYKGVCSNCGNVDSSTTSTFVKGGTKMTGSYNCTKCQTRTDIKIKAKEKVTFQ